MAMRGRNASFSACLISGAWRDVIYVEAASAQLEVQLRNLPRLAMDIAPAVPVAAHSGWQRAPLVLKTCYEEQPEAMTCGYAVSGRKGDPFVTFRGQLQTGAAGSGQPRLRVSQWSWGGEKA